MAQRTPDLAVLLKSRTTVLWVVTREELRVERAVIEAAAKVGYDPRVWDCAAGVRTASGESPTTGPRAEAQDPEEVLRWIGNADAAGQGKTLWIMRDLHRWLASPSTIRLVKNLARDLQAAPAGKERAVVVLTPSGQVPEDLQGSVTVLDWPLPDRDEVGRILDESTKAASAGLAARAEKGDTKAAARRDRLQASVQNGLREAAIDAAVGLTAEEIAGCYARSLVSSGTIDADAVRKDKASVVSRERVLEWYEPNPRGLDAIGGLDRLKRWLITRRTAFSAKARAFGLPAPKGVLLVGHPGCGKSLTAKAVATAWGMPLLRLDLGALKSKFVGESEGNIRKALKTAEAVAPAILWLDEVEKAMAGSTGPQGDGGVGSDALGTILTWLQERAGAVFLVATANDVRSLPPELLRKGRFDAIFFIDLPTQAERVQILAGALKAHGRSPGDFDLDLIARNCPDYTGAELAAIVPDALFGAFADGERELTDADLLAAAQSVVPLAKTSAEKVADLRAWAKGRAQPASSIGETAAVQVGLGRMVEVGEEAEDLG